MSAQLENVSFRVPFQTNVLALAQTAKAEVTTVTKDTHDFATLLPASSRSKRDFSLNGQEYRGMDVIERAEATTGFLEKELGVPRLNGIHDHLWLAGRPIPPRPLNYQAVSSRAIAVSEDIQLHLVWEPGRMFLKPLPRYLLDPTFWKEHLVCYKTRDSNCPCFESIDPRPESPVENAIDMCPKRELHKCAHGLLLSYTALIQYESDYHIAKDQHLLPEGVEWQSWRKLSRELLEHSPHNTSRVNKRYQFGELRLGRLNMILRVKSLFGSPSSNHRLVDVMRGYRLEFATYGQQIEGFLAPILAATAYILLVLTAMQVGLGTKRLQESVAFQRASYGFTVFSILGPLILVVAAAFTVLLFVLFNYNSTKKYLRKRMAFHAGLGN